MLPWISLQAEECHSGEAKSVQSLGIWEKVQVDLKPHSCQLSKAFCSGDPIPAQCERMNSPAVASSFLGAVLCTKWSFAVSLYSPPRLHDTSKGCSSPRNPVTPSYFVPMQFISRFHNTDQLSAFHFGKGKDTRRD